MYIADILETMMIVCFGISWPLSIIRSYRSRSTKGKSLIFMLCIVFGYLCGVGAKLMSHTYNLAFYFYFINIFMVSVDICLYVRNRNYEKSQAEAEASV